VYSHLNVCNEAVTIQCCSSVSLEALRALVMMIAIVIRIGDDCYFSLAFDQPVSIVAGYAKVSV